VLFLPDFETPDYQQGYREEVGPDDLKRHYADIVSVCDTNNAISGKTIMDIGASGGAYMIGVSQFAKTVMGVEPNEEQRRKLSARYKMYASIEEAVKEQEGKIDTVTAWHVIEHVDDPIDFLQSLSELLTDNGRIYISTPNQREILMKLLPDEFSPFFYRAWHSHYFTLSSIINCITLSGMSPLMVDARHSWGLSNCLGWMKEKKPVGKWEDIEPHQSELIDVVWQSYLKEIGMGDTLYAVIAKDGGLH